MSDEQLAQQSFIAKTDVEDLLPGDCLRFSDGDQPGTVWRMPLMKVRAAGRQSMNIRPADHEAELLHTPIFSLLKDYWEDLPSGLQEEICIILADAESRSDVNHLMNLSVAAIRELSEKGGNRV